MGQVKDRRRTARKNQALSAFVEQQRSRQEESTRRRMVGRQERVTQRMEEKRFEEDGDFFDYEPSPVAEQSSFISTQSSVLDIPNTPSTIARKTKKDGMLRLLAVAEEETRKEEEDTKVDEELL